MNNQVTRTWCCHTLIGQPHVFGCQFEPRPDDHIYTPAPASRYTYRLRIVGTYCGYDVRELVDWSEADAWALAEQALTRDDVWHVDLARRPLVRQPAWETLISTNKGPPQ